MSGIDADYAAAVVVQLDIAEYHRDRLKLELEERKNWEPRRVTGFRYDFPPIEVQAHPEGVLAAVYAAKDKLLEGIAVAHGLTTDPTRRPRGYEEMSDDQRLAGPGVSPRDVVRLLLERAEPELTALYQTWKKDSYVKVANELRRRAVHHVSTKKLRSEAWEYAASSALRSVDRRLVPFASTLVSRSQVLRNIVMGLDRSMRNGTVMPDNP